jgi:mono/diheme cytochrome c family protein
MRHSPLFKWPLTLVGEWTADQLETAIRYGVDDEGEGLIPVMPFTLYESMSDQDMGDLIAYVQSLEPMGEDVPELLFADPSMTRDMFLFRGEIDIEAERPAPDPADLVARGAYLANQASCMHCHGQAGPTFEVTPYPAGLPWGFFGPPLLPFFMDTKYASSDEVKTVLTTGTRPDGTMLAPAMPWMVIPLWPESDVDALVAWIDSLPEVDPSENPNPPAAPPAGASLDGATLVEQRCTACHDTARIENATKDETAWTATVDRMIGYGAVLSDEERAALIAYLVSMSMD